MKTEIISYVSFNDEYWVRLEEVKEMKDDYEDKIKKLKKELQDQRDLTNSLEQYETHGNGD